jgi:hypothetical protein
VVTKGHPSQPPYETGGVLQSRAWNGIGDEMFNHSSVVVLLPWVGALSHSMDSCPPYIITGQFTQPS